MTKPIRERDIVRYLVDSVKAKGGLVRKIQWIGRSKAPDTLLLLPTAPGALVEVKNPDSIRTFPANAHERAQAREHARLRKQGVRVEVVGTFAQVDALLS